MNGKFDNQTVVITGGAAGIGEAAARKFAAEGASVAIWDVNIERGKALENELQKTGSKIRFIKVNTAEKNEVNAAAQETTSAFGAIHVLINNAGITRDASFLKMSNEQWQDVMGINLTGIFNCCKAIAPLMVERYFGRIINTSSIVGLYGNYGQANYAAAKGGVIAFTKTLSRELGKHNITVNAVAPGFIATDMIKTMPEKVIAAMSEKVPLRKLGTPEDVANVYAFLASSDAQFISGAVISVDGGLTI